MGIQGKDYAQAACSGMHPLHARKNKHPYLLDCSIIWRFITYIMGSGHSFNSVVLAMGIPV